MKKNGQNLHIELTGELTMTSCNTRTVGVIEFTPVIFEPLMETDNFYFPAMFKPFRTIQ